MSTSSIDIFKGLYDTIRDGGELELPSGLAKRLTANGWKHPLGDRYIREILEHVMEVTEEGDINAVAAFTLQNEGVYRL